jgi:ABC-type proline/glycine betaine transport system ATPase subunit
MVADVLDRSKSSVKDLYPSQLSGGQQLVGVARAIS